MNSIGTVTYERRIFGVLVWRRKVRVPVQPATTPSANWMTDAERAYHMGGGFARG